jgi:hypothetical protein
MIQFEVGKSYSMRSACMHDCIWTYKVVNRTASTVTIMDGEKFQRCRISKKISEYIGAETIFPLGQYSMAPTLSADKVS